MKVKITNKDLEDFNSLNKPGYYGIFTQTRDLDFTNALSFTPVSKTDSDFSFVYDGNNKKIKIPEDFSHSVLFEKLNTLHTVKHIKIINEKKGFSLIQELAVGIGSKGRGWTLSDIDIESVGTPSLLISNRSTIEVDKNSDSKISFKNIHVTITSDFDQEGGILLNDIYSSLAFHGELILENITLKAKNNNLVLKGGLISSVYLRAMSVKDVEIENVKELQVDAKNSAFVGFLVNSVTLKEQLSIQNVQISLAENPILRLQISNSSLEQNAGFGGYFGHLKSKNNEPIEINLDKTPLPNYDPCWVNITVAGETKSTYSKKLFGLINNPNTSDIFTNIGCENKK